MSCNNIEDISVNMCNKICNDNIPASNTVRLTSCKTKCNQKIIGELNPLDITNNFIFLNSADVAENALEKAGEQSQELYKQKQEMMNNQITNMETEIRINNNGCGIRIGVKWKKIINGDTNEFIDDNYIKKFKKYSAFGLKWKNVGTTEPNSKYIKLVKGTTISNDSYDYLHDALINGKDTQNNIILNKKALIDNNLFQDDDTKDLKIYPNSYIKLSDNSYCQVYTYDTSIIHDDLKSIFNHRDDFIDLTFNVHFKNAFHDITMDDFITNNSGDIYIPSIGCTDFNNKSCNDIEDVLSANENCMVDNKDNDYIKRKDTIPYLFHNDAGSQCMTKALNFDNKNELFDIINLITNDQFINHELNEMMGKYDAYRYENIKTRINDILTDEYSQYFSTNDFLNLFDYNIQYWITIDDAIFSERPYRYNRANTDTGKNLGQATGTYDVRDGEGDVVLQKSPKEKKYNEIAKILSNRIPAFPSSNHLIQLQDIDVETIRTLFKPETTSENRELESLLWTQDYFNIIDDNGNSTKVILYTPLYEHFDNRYDIYYNSHSNSHDDSSKSGVDFYKHLKDGQRKITVKNQDDDDVGVEYGRIGYDTDFYNNVILSDNYITKTECETIKLNVENTSNTIFLKENIENRHNLDKYRLNDIDFNNVNDELTQYNTNIENLNRCIENSKAMINLDTYTKTKEYDNINENIRDNAEINKKYNIYLSKVNKYEGIQTDTDCKFLSEYNNKDTCGIPSETTKMCLSDDFISDTQYDTKLQSKKDSLKSYIFNRQKNYYVGKNTLINPNTWQITTGYPNIGLELVNTDLTVLLDTKSITATDNIITLSDDELLPFSNSKIDNNTYVSSYVTDRYYTVNLQQENCNQPNDYVLQNSDNICGNDKQCAYKNEYNNSISEISQYDDNLCTNKYNYLEECYNQDPDFVMGKQVDYSVCRDDQQKAPRIIDCPQTEDPQCPSGSYITYKIENGRYTCEKVCGSCVHNTTLKVSDSKCHADIGYYYDYEYDELESTSPPVPEQCHEGYYIDVTSAKTIEECKKCTPACDTDHYENVDCTFSTNRVCTQLPDNSTKNQNGKDFSCVVNYFKRGDQCVACPNETTSDPGSTSILECIANEGHYFDPQSLADDETSPIPVSAEQCDDGTYCASGATSETSCPTNTTSVAGSSDISQCHALPGFYYNNDLHNVGQSCLPGHYCPGGPGSTTQNPCPANTYNSLSQQTDVNACNPCDYETTSVKGSEACTACPTIPIVAADISAIRKYKYYEYQVPGCSTITTGTCSNQQLSQESLNDDDCPTTTTITDADGRTITKKQFYGYTGVVQRNTTTGKPILFPNDTIKEKEESQEELTRKLKFEDPDMLMFEYSLGTHVDLKCEKTCMTCFPNEKFIPNLSACDPCEDNKVAGTDGLSCIPCHERDANTIYDAELGDCTLCNDYQLPNFESNTCENPQPGYYVVCDGDADACKETEATVNHIVLGQINKVDWIENIKSIIFDYEDQTPGEITNNINIIFRNDSWNEDKILKLTKNPTIMNNKYYKDISKKIIIFENNTQSTDYLIKFMESIYISNNTQHSSLPNKLILQTENDSYYLLTHRMQEDITNRYSTAAIWDHGQGEGESYLIFDMFLNITNEQYLCPDNTYIDDGTEASGSSRGTNRNICKFYDSGYYRDIYSSSGASSTEASSASTEETPQEPFTNYENFESRTQTTCLKDFTLENKATIDITDSKLGAQAGGDYAGCVYKCNTAGHYYNEGTPGLDDNKCVPCPIGYKCDNLQNRTACIGQEYQNETGQTECKTIPTGGTAIPHSEGLANIGFSVPAGKKYSNIENINTISDCSKDTYKDTISPINDQETEREIECLACPTNTTTKKVLGSTELAQCIPDFGYTLDTTERLAEVLEGYDVDSSGSIQCASGYYLGDFDGNCDITNSNQCTECIDDNYKACIPCPTGYTCAGGSVDCKETPAFPLIKLANIDDDPFTAPIYNIDACWPGMKLTTPIGGECDPCHYTSGGSETNKYCFDGTPKDHISPSTDDIKLKNNDNFTPAIYITAADNINYNIYSITQDTGDSNNIVFSFKNNYIPFNIENYLEVDIRNLKDNDVPLYLYEHASGEKNANQILNAKNVTQETGVSINNNTINLLKEGYINKNDSSNIIRNIIESNNLKFTGDGKNALLDIIMSYKDDRAATRILDDINLSFIYEFAYYDGTQLKTQSYVYKILPYPSLCDAGTHTTTGLINSCEYCPIGTYKSETDATLCQNATGNYYVGVHDLSASGSPSGLGGIKATEMPTSNGFEILTTSDGGNYGYKLKSGYEYTAPTHTDIATTTECGTTSFNEEEILINNTIDNTTINYPCDSCPEIASLPSSSQTGLLRLETNSPTSTTATACVIRVCDTNYTNIGSVNTNLCELEKCQKGYYFDGTSNSCERCPVGHYCDGDPTILPTASSHQKRKCPRNTYNPTLGIAEVSNCEACPLNTSTNELLGQTALGNCIADSGYYFDSASGDTATQCPTNTSTGDATGSTSITDCISNARWYFNSSTDTTATICPSGKYCPINTIGPKESLPTCPTNTTSEEGSSNFSDCRADPGWYYPWNSLATDVGTLANECPEKTYCEGANESSVDCPLNTNTGGGRRKIKKSECVADPGYYYDITDTTHEDARACPVGTYNPNNSATSVDGCIKCPENTYSVNTARTANVDCLTCPDNSKTTYDDAGNPVQAGVETTGKSLLADCKPGKMYKRNDSNTNNDPLNEIILKTGHTKSETGGYTCDEGYYFNVENGECETCHIRHYCPGGPAVSGGAITLECPTFSTSPARSSVIDNCFAMTGYKQVGDTNVFVENEGVKTDSNGVVFKEGSTTLVQCEPGYEGKTDSDLECQPCVDRSTFSTDGNECSLCGTSNDLQLVIKECDHVTNVIRIDKSLLRIESFETDNIVTALEIPDLITAQQLYTTYITPQQNTYPNYKFFDTTTDNLYFIKLPITYTDLPVTNTANIHSNVIDSHIIDNVIVNSTPPTSSYLKIISFINNTDDTTDILDLCYFPYNGVNYDVFLLLPKCGCIPGTSGDNCHLCPTEEGTGRETFQPDYNQTSCISVPTTILDDSYSFIKDETYNIGVNLNAGWALNKFGASSLCAEDTYYASSTDITNHIVSGSGDYTPINCVGCPTGSGTQDRDSVTGATNILDCTVKFGYTKTSAGTVNTLPIYGYNTGYGDDLADGTIDCLPGYYFDLDGTNGTCMECPKGHYCTGGIAQSGIPGTAVQTPCPIGTYKDTLGGSVVTECKLIDIYDEGRGYYGTMEGIDRKSDVSFKECPEHTTINTVSQRNSIYDCTPDAKYQVIETNDPTTGQLALNVSLLPQYYENPRGIITCLPGTLSTDDGLCTNPDSEFDYNGDGDYYLSGSSNDVDTCADVDTENGDIELSQCDAFKNRFLTNIPNFMGISGGSGGEKVISCNKGFLPVFLDRSYEDEEKNEEIYNYINNYDDYYLYEFDAKILNEVGTDDSVRIDANFHLNQNDEVADRLNTTIDNNNLKIQTDDLAWFKFWVKEYTTEKKNKADYKLQFYKDVNVYKNDRPDPIVTMRYIYGILPLCVPCPDGSSNRGEGDECKPCPAGTRQGMDNQDRDRVCIKCEGDTYQDLEGEKVCKQLPSSVAGDRFGYTKVYNEDLDPKGGIKDYNINSGYMWDGDKNVIKCPKNTVTDPYGDNGRIKINATGCTACPANEYQAENLSSCQVCTQGFYYNTEKHECVKCGTDSYFDGTTAETGLGINKWELKQSISTGDPEYMYCRAAAIDGCQGQLYTYDETNQMCKLNQCAAGEYFDETECRPCPAGFYCPSTVTIIQQDADGAWKPAPTACAPGTYQQNTGQGSCEYCPDNTDTTSSGSSHVNQCKAKAGHFGNPATQCGVGTFKNTIGDEACTQCGSGLTTSGLGSTASSFCLTDIGYTGNPGNPATQCGVGTYKNTIGDGACSQCGSGLTTSGLGSTASSFCLTDIGYTGNPGNPATQCGVGTYKNTIGDGACTQCGSGLTTFGPGSDNVTDCIAASGYYATPGDGSLPNYAQECPGVPESLGFPYTVPSEHRISTAEGARASVNDCIYDECDDGYYRNEYGLCINVTGPPNQDACDADEIFVPYRKSGELTTYSDYNAAGADISNYSLPTMYGHDNLCLPVSDICTA